MILIPAGTESVRKFHDKKKWLSSNYRMSVPSDGKNQEQSLYQVPIRPFQIGRYPVTNDLYTRITKKENTGEPDPKKPRVSISWFDSILFCNEISRFYDLPEYYSIDRNAYKVECYSGSPGFRLPTEAEWQYASKGGSEQYQYGEIDAVAWHKGNSGGSLHNVGDKRPNPWGLYDTLGNVWEWCWDLFNPETYGPYRIFRGGSYAEEKRVCGSTTRRKSHPDFAIDDLGFRLARSVD